MQRKKKQATSEPDDEFDDIIELQPPKKKVGTKKQLGVLWKPKRKETDFKTISSKHQQVKSVSDDSEKDADDDDLDLTEKTGKWMGSLQLYIKQ